MRLAIKKRSRLRAWLQLVRVPNLFTAPGDPLAGLFLAAAATGRKPSALQIVLLPLAATALYASGMIFNDICDVDEDALARPQRPLPSQKIAMPAAQLAAAACALSGLGLCFIAGRRVFVTALMLALVISAYNLCLKHHRLYGPVAMGLCRGFSLLLGAAVFGWPAGAVIIAALLTAYIAAVTRIAEFENRLHDHGRVAWLPSYFLALSAVCGTVILSFHTRPLYLAMGLAIFVTGLLLNSATGRALTVKAALPGATQRAVGNLIQHLLFLQGGLLVMCPGILSTGIGIMVLAILWPANAYFKHLFASS